MTDAPTAPPDAPPIRLAPRAAARIRDIAGAGGLRLAVLGGGCSGFQYEMTIAAGPEDGDLVLEQDGGRLFLDPVSAPLVAGSELDWVEELIGSAFKVRNPNAKSSCGCGVSFSL